MIVDSDLIDFEGFSCVYMGFTKKGGRERERESERAREICIYIYIHEIV